MVYTTEFLASLGACPEAILWAETNMVEGQEVTVADIKKVPEPMWIWWLACRLDESRKLIWSALEIGFRDAARNHPDISTFETINESNWREAYQVAEDAYHSGPTALMSVAKRASTAAAIAGMFAKESRDMLLKTPWTAAWGMARSAVHIAELCAAATGLEGSGDAYLNELKELAIAELVKKGVIKEHRTL